LFSWLWFFYGLLLFFDDVKLQQRAGVIQAQEGLMFMRISTIFQTINQQQGLRNFTLRPRGLVTAPRLRLGLTSGFSRKIPG
jgi:hypothetical protein